MEREFLVTLRVRAPEHENVSEWNWPGVVYSSGYVTGTAELVSCEEVERPLDTVEYLGEVYEVRKASKDRLCNGCTLFEDEHLFRWDERHCAAIKGKNGCQPEGPYGQYVIFVRKEK